MNGFNRYVFKQLLFGLLLVTAEKIARGDLSLKPSRITVIENDSGQVQLVAMNLQAVAALFNNAQLSAMSREIQATQMDIIEEATF